MPFLSAQQLPQFDNADFESSSTCPNSILDEPISCVDGWWMWNNNTFQSNAWLSYQSHPNLKCNDVGSRGLHLRRRTTNSPADNKLHPGVCYTTANPLFLASENEYGYSISGQMFPAKFNEASSYVRIIVFGTNNKSVSSTYSSTPLPLNPNVTALGISKIHFVDFPSGDVKCKKFSILLDAQVSEFEYLIFAIDRKPFVEAEPEYLTHSLVIDNLKICESLEFVVETGCDDICLDIVDLACIKAYGTDLPIESIAIGFNSGYFYDAVYESNNGQFKDICFDTTDPDVSELLVDGTNSMWVFFELGDPNGGWKTKYVAAGKIDFEFYTPKDYSVPSGFNGTWTASNVPNGGKFNTLTIEPGATLTINPGVTLTFTQNGELDIKPGGRLKNKGTLTACDDFWQGVRVIGNESLSQYPVTNQGYYSGYPKSVIEKAKIGIMNCNSNTVNRGGLIKTYLAIFRNNGIAVQMLGKGNVSQVPSAISDNSFFYRNTFIVNNKMPDALKFHSFIDLNFINMSKVLSLRSNHFIVDKSISAPPTPNFGIRSFVSNFRASRNDFFRLHTGVEALGISFFGPQTYTTTYNKFEDCWTGIHNRAVSGSYMRNNDFLLGNVPASYHAGNPAEQTAQRGIVLESHIADFFMEENTFKTKGGNQHYTIGSQCTNIGQNYYKIRNNHYRGVSVGNLAYLTNGKKQQPTPGSFNNGLTYLCNENSSNGADDFYVAHNSIVHPIQRYVKNSQTKATLNSFSYDPSIEWDFGNHGKAGIKYYYDPSYPNNKPRDTYITGVEKKVKYTSNHCITKKGPQIGKDGVITDVKENRQKYFTAHSQYVAAKQELIQAELQQNDALAETKRKQTYAYKIAADEAAFNGYIYAVLDSTGASTDSIPLWLGRMERMEADLALAGWYHQSGQPETAKVILDDLQQKYALMGDQVTELDRYQDALDLIGEQPLEQLNESTRNHLRLLAVDDGSLSSAFAKNVLSLYGEYYPPIMVDVALNTNKASTDEITTKESKMHVSPNPTDSYVRFDWSIFNVNDAPVTIELRNKMGVLLQTIQGVPGEYTKEISLEAYQGGIIYYHLISKGVELDAGQIILNK